MITTLLAGRGDSCRWGGEDDADVGFELLAGWTSLLRLEVPTRPSCGSFSDESKAPASFLARFVNRCSSKMTLRVLHLNIVSAISPRKGTRPMAPSKMRFAIINFLIFLTSLASLPPDIRIAELINHSARRKSSPSPILQFLSTGIDSNTQIFSRIPTQV